MQLFPLVTLFTASVAIAAQDFVIEKEFEAVTCGSSVKLAHSATGYRLHSHQVTYGSGSGQQSVTGLNGGDDPNSLFVVDSAFGAEQCKRGEPFKCDDIIRLNHLNTKKYLHSHAHVSPLSNQQEVSAYEFTNNEDNWKVICTDKRDKFWKRESKVRLQHVATQKYLSASTKYQFRNPIPGQLEVCGTKSAGNNEIWQVQEGIFFGEPDL
ncbi:MIR motif-containing protein [Chytriomyces sp. MP71]|nr:MIR motif-containing protein [Chytriomyces sp. MP71]